jgi:uncharacterized membrane protein (UPF0127 family)
MFARLFRLIANRSPSARARVEISTASNSVYLNLEIADNPWRRALGMMGKTEIHDGDGMIFVYPRPRNVRLWMANTPLSLDAIFVAETGHILKVAHRLQPYSRRWVASGAPTKWVLEIAGGQALRLGIAAGDSVHLPI